MDIHCPNCHSVLYLQALPAGTPVECTACGAVFTVSGETGGGSPGGGMVIDVHAEPVHGSDPETETAPGETYPHPDTAVSKTRRASGSRAGTEYVFIEKRFSSGSGSDFGCCGCGCFLLLLFFILFVAGCTAIGVW